MKFRFLNESADISRSLLKKALVNSGVKLPKDESLTEDVSSDSDEFQAYITNLGAYNEGELRGEWVTFPIDEDEFDEILEKIGCTEPGYEEWFVTDYDCDCDAQGTLGEYPSLEQLNEFAEMIEDDAFKALLDYLDFEDAKSTFESGDYQFYPSDVYSWTDYAEQYVDGIGGVEQLGRDTIESYFDYEALGRELDFESYETEDDDGETQYVSAGEYWCGDEGASDYDIGEAYVDEVGFDGVGNPEYYFDFEKFGRDISFESSGGPTDFGFIVYF